MNEWRVQSRRPNKSIQKALNGPVWMKENVCIVNGEYYKEYAFDGKIEWKMGIPNEALCLASIARGYPRTKLVLSHAMEFSVFVPDSCTVPERCRAVSQRRVDRKALARVNDIVCVMEYFHSKNQPFSTVFTRGILDRGIFVRHEGSIPRTVETSNMLQGYSVLCEWGGSSHTTGSTASLHMQPPEILVGIPRVKRDFKKEDIWRMGEWSGIILSEQGDLSKRWKLSTGGLASPDGPQHERSRHIRFRGLITEMEPVTINEWPELRCGKHFSESTSLRPLPSRVFGEEHTPVLPTDIAPPIRMLLSKCLRIIPKRRVGLTHIRKSPLFAYPHAGKPYRTKRMRRSTSCMSRSGISDSGKHILNHLMHHCTHSRSSEAQKTVSTPTGHALISWMYETTQNIHGTDDTFVLSTLLMKDWVRNMRLEVDSKLAADALYATALACAWISAKLLQSKPLYATDMVRCSDRSVSVSTLIHKEQVVIDELSGHIDRVTSLHFLRIMMAELYCTKKERAVLTQDLVSRTLKSQWTHRHPLEDAWCVIATRLKRDPARMKRLRDALQSMDLVHRSNIKLKDVQVQSVRNESLQRTASSPSQHQSRDPGTMFPTEVLVHILSFLPFREGVNVARVSKIWNRASYYPFRSNTPWSLSRSEFPCISNDVLIRNIMPRIRKRKIRHLNLSGQTLSSMTVLKILIQCQDLKSLCVSNVKIGERSRITLKIGEMKAWKVQSMNEQYNVHLPDTMRFSLESIDVTRSNLFTENPKVMDFILERCPRLKKLRAIRCNCISKESIRALSRCTELEELSVDSSSALVDPNRVSIQDIAVLASNVKTKSFNLKMRCIPETCTNNRHLVPTLLQSVGRRMKSLSLTGYWISTADVVSIMNACPALIGLRVLTECIIDLHAFCHGSNGEKTDLVALSIGSFVGCTPTCIENIFAYSPNLRELHLYRGSVSDSALMEIVKDRPALKRFLMRSCEGYTSFGLNRMYAIGPTIDIQVTEGRARPNHA